LQWCILTFFTFQHISITQGRDFIVIFLYMHVIYFDHIYFLYYPFLSPFFTPLLLFFFKNGFYYGLFIHAYDVLQSYSTTLSLLPPTSCWFTLRHSPIYVHVFFFFRSSLTMREKTCYLSFWVWFILLNLMIPSPIYFLQVT
jgi:hypothetical protein